MGQITRFVAGTNTYTFPTAHGDQDYHDNFAEVMTRFSRIAAADGGIDEHGNGRAPGGVGNVQVGMVLESGTREGMQVLRDSLKALRDWGVGQLYFQPTDTLLAPRWCICRAKNIDIKEKRQQHTDLFQPVSMTFEASEPFWMTAGNQNLWDGTYNWNGAINWDGASLTTITGSGSLTVTNSGNAYTLGRFVAQVTGAQAFNQLIVRRTVNNGVIDQWVVNYPFVQNDVIEVDPRKQWVIINGYDQFAAFTFRHPDWLRLPPGSNTITVTTDQAAAQLSTVVRYYERYV